MFVETVDSNGTVEDKNNYYLETNIIKPYLSKWYKNFQLSV